MRAQRLRKAHERGVGEIHLHVRVLLHQHDRIDEIGRAREVDDLRFDPESRLVLVLERGKDPVERRPGGWLTGSPVLPRFRMRVESVFVDLAG